MKKWKVTSVVFCVSALLSTAVMGCRQKQPDSSAGSTSSAEANVGVVQSYLGFAVTPIIDDANVGYYFHEQSSFSSACRVAQGETNYSRQDIYCMLDMNELDLYFNPITLNWNVPAGMCPYTLVNYYSFYRYQPSPDPNTLSIAVTLDVNGNVDSVTGGSIDSSGNPICSYDYTATQGPNCCEGTWTVTTTSSTGGVSVTTGSFAGHRSACLAGPGIKFSKADTDGNPMPTVYRTFSAGFNAAGVIDPPINPPSGMPFATNLYNANYFNPTDLNSPTSVFPPAPTTGTGYVAAAYNPYYEFACLDEAFDPIARIRILIRSWDTLANFNAQNNPYNSTTQANWNDSYHDRWVWKDHLTTYPGNSL